MDNGLVSNVGEGDAELGHNCDKLKICSVLAENTKVIKGQTLKLGAKDLQLNKNILLLHYNKQQLHKKDQEIQKQRPLLQEKTRQLQEKGAEIHHLHEYIATIHSTLGWRILNKIRKVRNWFLPEGTRRRRLYYLFVKSIIVLKTQGIRSFLRKFKNWLLK